MSAAELLTQPLWKADALGCALPRSRHAVSVALPRWSDVVGYEEKRPEVLQRMECGYPRFVIHPLVAELGRRAGAGQPGLVFPSARSAAAAAAYVRRHPGLEAEVFPGFGAGGDWHFVRTQVGGLPMLQQYWQHTGLIVSSRQAEAALEGRSQPAEADAVRGALRRLLATYYGCREEDVFLTPTGMAAQFLAMQALRRRAPGHQTAQLGFPYVDTLKVQQRLGNGAELLHRLDTMDRDLGALLERHRLAGCFAEIPGNPLLGSADLRRITPILRARAIPLVADDVVATPVNVDLAGHADLVATSLTKYFVGTADAMGGALICHPGSPFHQELRGFVAMDHEELLWGDDAAVLLREGGSFPQRMEGHNRNGLSIAERLRRHPAVERVWYPRWEFAEVYEGVKRSGGGYGSLITFLPRNAAKVSPEVYDRLEVCKGPSLGTIFTLACPFTLLAHYTELDWAEDCGVSRHLIRLSVGLEDPDELWGRIDRALTGPEALAPASGAP